jgi:phosphoribosyl 1,2-cyclic phosphate phosphodiesterase
MAKNKSIKIIFLGTGANGGVPQLDCRCRNCKDTVSKRNRSSLLIEFENKKFIVDCGPDFRISLLNNNLRLSDLTGILLSHLHWDHCFGLVELSGGQPQAVPILVPKKIRDQLLMNSYFKYLFDYKFAIFKRANKVGINLKYHKVYHDPRYPSYALIIKTENKQICIATDIARITNDLIHEFKKADLVIFDGTFLSKSTHSHIAIEKSVLILSKVCKNVIYTHINHSESSELIKDFLSRHKYSLAEDQMSIEI